MLRSQVKDYVCVCVFRDEVRLKLNDCVGFSLSHAVILDYLEPDDSSSLWIQILCKPPKQLYRLVCVGYTMP